MTDADALAELEQQERELVLDAFDHDTAWELGSRITELARAAGAAVAVDIRRPGLILFRAALRGSVPDQESWIARKSAVVLRLESSSALAAARFTAGGGDPSTGGWLGPDYALTGGSFPLRVRGVGVVAAATVSGLASMDDHDLVVEGLRGLLGR
ncbi:heme-degrading domain-containing protein [Rathayibacter sp. VKM Ac-2803]|uniref:heme-degrading domain-containing protein n=1 Tax=Rathayibacter sp. VKM Ac-2803 TaxID=2609256 RepID=UPI00135A7D76|nr:heme-degrading domain-containing protein [Rathayibacter sp. VKM Ac-2803]MWV48747.1 heme-degrading domain-containing protein [Rathayibacter sp. VKM Ac-2803]